MPITKSAKKSLKVSRTKKIHNDKVKISLSKALNNTDEKNISQTFSMIDKAAKRGIIHKNKAARMKSALSKKFGTPKIIQKSKSVPKGKNQNVNVKSKKTIKKTVTKKSVKK